MAPPSELPTRSIRSGTSTAKVSLTAEYNASGVSVPRGGSLKPCPGRSGATMRRTSRFRVDITIANDIAIEPMPCSTTVVGSDPSPHVS